MALVFDFSDIGVKFLPNDEPDTMYKKELIIYPVLAYKIYTPVIDDMKLNLFQKHILSILNKGNFNSHQIAEWLGLDLLLVNAILIELCNKGLYDTDKYCITKKGIEVVDGTFSWFNNADNLRKDIRYIFQDIHTHELFPLIISIEDFQNNMYLDLSKAVLHVGSKGKKASFSAKLINLEKINLNKIQRPEIEDVYIAFDEHSKIYNPNSPNDLKNIPDAIQFQSEEPELLFLATWLFVKKNKSELNDIEVLDPFNVYDEPFWLKKNLLEASEKNIKLAETLDSLVTNIEQEQKEKASEFMLAFHKELEKEINTTYDYTIKDFPEIYESVKEFYYDINFYSINKKAADLKNAFIKSQIVLETLFKVIHQKFPGGYQDVLDVSTNNSGKLSEITTAEVAAKVIRINPDSSLPAWNSRKFNSKSLFDALTFPDKASLRALYVSAALASYYDNTNPMFFFLRSKNDLLPFLEEVAEGRNKVGHKYVDIPNDEIGQYYEDVLTIQKDVKEIITLFLQT